LQLKNNLENNTKLRAFISAAIQIVPAHDCNFQLPSLINLGSIAKLEESASLQNGMAAVRGTCSAYGCSELALNLSIHGRFSKDSLAQGQS